MFRYIALTLSLLVLMPASAQQVSDRVFATAFEVIEYSVTVTPSSAILTPEAETTLFATVQDATGAPVSGAVSWLSSDPDVVSVNGGLLTANDAIGSAVITVSAPGATQAQVLVVVAEPEFGAKLVGDSEVISITPPVDSDSVGPGTVYDVILAGEKSLAADQALIGTGDKPVAGRVLAVQPEAGNTRVTLETVPVHQLFEALEINQRIDLSQLPVSYPTSVTDNFTVTRDASGSIFLNPRSSRTTIIGTSAFFDFDRDCERDVVGFEQALSVAPGENLHFSPSLSLDFVYTDQGFQRLVVEGDIQAVFELQPRLRAQITGKVECKLQLGLIRLPVGGAFSLLFSGLVPLGAGFALDATVSTTEEIGYDFTVSAGAQPRIGIACETECDLVKELNLSEPQSVFRPVVPPSVASLNDTLKLGLNVFGFAYADLSFGNPFIEALQFDSLSVKAGVRQMLDLEQRDSQLSKPNYASSFALDLVAKVGLGNSIQEFLDALDISLIPVGLEITNPISQSAQGSLTISGPDGPGVVKADEVVTFSVALDPPTYFGFDGIGEVRIYRKQQNQAGFTLTPAICPSITPDPSGAGSCEGVFSENDVGIHTYVAVYDAKLFGITLPIPLEIARDSSTALTVETAIEPGPQEFFGVNVCAEISNKQDSLDEDCPQYEDGNPTSDSASASAGEASANVSAIASPSTITITSSATSSSSTNFAFSRGCGFILQQFETVAPRSLTVTPGLTSLTDSEDAGYGVYIRACASTNAQKGCQGEVEGNISYVGNSDKPGRIELKTGIFENFTGGSVTASLQPGNSVNIEFCSTSVADPSNGSVSSGGNASVRLN